jgi:hypothetical protein
MCPAASYLMKTAFFSALRIRKLIMPVATCPSAEMLRRFAAGELADAEARSLATHLDSCESCAQSLAAADSTAQRTGVSPALSPDEAELLARVEREALAALADTADRRKRQWTSAAEEGEPTAPGEGDLDLPGLAALFDPPQRPGSMGSFAGYEIVRLLGAGGMGLVFEAGCVAASPSSSCVRGWRRTRRCGEGCCARRGPRRRSKATMS